ncbi:MAG: xanthine dehydrogenase small subunit [Bacteroidetes bacterium RIFCSPLOWO2_12_FULL_31_6]|nr:MAG: xanthine dehydrogenase small subunit [Bacteroidetes bacterium RIFCSPLOWO2_12_FULL_31_6]
MNFDQTNGLSPTTTVLQFLRNQPSTKGTKEGCAEGDCGACTVVLASLNKDNKLEFKAYDSCLLFLPMIHGKQLITVEYLKTKTAVHPVQQAMVDTDGSQCGYCTPGFIMSLFALYKSSNKPSREEIDDALTGNLCRCTGYRPIIEAAIKSCENTITDNTTINEEVVIELLKEIKQPKEIISILSDSQKYFKPNSIVDTLKLKFNYPTAIIVSGATDIALRVTKKHELLSEIIDISNVDELKQCSVKDEYFYFGSGLNLEDIRLKSKNILPALYKMLCVFGSRQIRNMATLGGNIANASPIGDMPPVLMAYNASVMLEGIYGKRELKINDFITGYRTTQLKPTEIISGIIIPKPEQNVIIQSYKISKRKDLDISTVSAAFSLKLNSNFTVNNIQMYYGGMAAMTKEPAQTKKFIIGKKWERETIEEAMKLIDQEFTPISDARSGAEARKIMAKNLLLKFWTDTINSQQ